MGSNNKIIELVKGSAILTLSNICIKAINFFLLPLYTKYLSPAQLGVSDTITTLVGLIFPILVMGLDSAFSAFFFDEKSIEHQKKVFNTVELILLGMSLIPFVLILFSGKIAIVLLGSLKYQSLIVIAMVSMAVNLWYLPYSILIRVQNRMGVFAAINVTASLSMVLLNVFFVSVLQLGERSLILSTLCIQGIQLVLFAWLGREPIKKTYFNKCLAKKMLKYAIPLIPMVIAAWILSASDRYIILYFKGEAEVGIYGIGARFANMVNVLANSVYMAYTTYAFSTKDEENSKQQYVKILDGFYFILVIAIFIISLYSKEIISFMADEQYYWAYNLIPCMLFAQLIYAINTIVGYGVAFKKKSIYMTISVGVGALINVLLNLIFIPQFGAIAAAYTTAIAYTVMAVLSYTFAQKVYPCNYHVKKLAVTTFVTFLIVVLIQDEGIIFKLLIGIVCLIMILIMYKTAINDMKKLLVRLIRK